MIKNNKRKYFTLLELIIVIVVIGILAGMALPKFTGVVRNSKVAAMITDIDTLEKALMMYEQDNNTLPIEEENISTFSIDPLSNEDMIDIYPSLQEALKLSEDSEDYLYKINLDESGKYHSKTKYGHGKNEKDFYVYSTKSNRVYYYGYLKDGDDKYNHNENPIVVEDNELVKKIPSKPIDNNNGNGNDNNNNSNLELDFSTKQDNIVFDSGDWGKEMFDGNEDTGTGISPYSDSNGHITWNGDLTNNIVEIITQSQYSNITINIVDENDNSLPYFELTKKVYAAKQPLGGSRTTYKIVMPKGAKKICFSRENNGSGSVQEIRIPKGSKPKIVDFENTTTEYSANLNFTIEDDYQKMIIFANKSLLAETTEKELNLEKLCAGTNYNLDIFLLSNENTINGIYHYNMITKDDGEGFYMDRSAINNYNLIDNDYSTSILLQSGLGGNSAMVELTKDLSNKQIKILCGGSYDTARIDFLDENKVKISKGNTLTSKESILTIPENTKYISLYGTNTFYKATIYEMELVK